MKGYINKLASYLPALIVQHLVNEYRRDPKGATPVPQKQRLRTACLFADVSGFTKLSEAMAIKYGPLGCQHVAQKLNQYFEKMLKHISKQGGDIFKFAGDAVFVLWPEPEDGNLVTCVRRAVQCALSLQNELHNSDMGEGVHLSVKVGIGVGDISILYFGGHNHRKEYVAVGAPLLQAFASEGKASAGQTVVSDKAWKMVSKFFPQRTVLGDGFAILERDCKYTHAAASKKPLLKIQKMFDEAAKEMGNEKLKRSLCAYIPYAIVSTLKEEMSHGDLQLEKWSSELRKVTILFVNLGLEESDLLAAAEYNDAVQRFQDVLVAVQQCLYKYEGSLNKFLMDDKGSTLIAIFGLAPLQHDDDATRGLLAGLAICEALAKMRLAASVGVTTGMVFCGKVGNRVRREYSVLGDVVNTSARLMGYVHKKLGGGVLCDRATYSTCCQRMLFERLDPIALKGKIGKTEIFMPYPPYMSKKLDMTMKRHESMEKIYREQRLLCSIASKGHLLRGESSGSSLLLEQGREKLRTNDALQMREFLHGSTSLTPAARRRMSSSAQSAKDGGDELTKLETLSILSPLLTVTPGSSMDTSDTKRRDPRVAAATSRRRFSTRRLARSASAATRAEISIYHSRRKRSNFRRETMRTSRLSSTDVLMDALSGASFDTAAGSSPRSSRTRSRLASDFGAIASKTLMDCTMSRSSSVVASRKNHSDGMLRATSIRAVGVRYANKELVEKYLPRRPPLEACIKVPGRIAWEGLTGTRDLLQKVLAICGAVNLIVAPRGRADTKMNRSSSLPKSRSDSAGMSSNVIAQLDLEVSLPIAANVYETEIFVPSFDMPLDALLTMIARSIDDFPANCSETIENGVLWLLAVDPETAHEIQGRHTFVEQQLVESEVRLQNGDGSIVVVEGTVGSGKTRMLSSLALPSIPLKWTCESLPYVLVAAADPCEWRAFGVWRSILKQFMKHIIHSSRAVVFKGGDVTADEFLRFFEHLPALQPFLSVVASLFDIVIDPTPLVAQLTADERDAVTRGLVLALLRSLCSIEGSKKDGFMRPCIILIDDAQWMDSSSWKLLTDIANCGLNIGDGMRLPSALRSYLHRYEMSEHMLPLMIVAATRPFSYYTDTHNKCRPPEYERLLEQSSVLFLKLGRLSRSAVSHVLRDVATEVVDKLRGEDQVSNDNESKRASQDDAPIVIHTNMIDTIWNFSAGNALLLHEIARGLALRLLSEASAHRGDALDASKKKLGRRGSADAASEPIAGKKANGIFSIVVNEHGHRVVNFSTSFDVESDIPFPQALHSVIGMQLDRLSIIHQLICKVASVIGPVFSFDEVCGSWPADGDEEMLAREINRLEDLDVIHCCGASHTKLKYAFNNPLLRHAVLERMLMQHQRELRQRGKVWQSSIEAKHREVVFRKDIALPKLNTECLVEKHEGGVFSNFLSRGWKQRVLELKDDGSEVVMRRHKNGEIVQRGLLQGADVASFEPKHHHDSTHKWGLQITVDKWVKKGVLEQESRLFKVLFASEQTRDEWKQWTQFCIERIAFRIRDKFGGRRMSSEFSSETTDLHVTEKITPRGCSSKHLARIKKEVLSEPLMQSLLFVAIRQGLGLQLHSCSTGREPSNPYVVLFLQGSSRRTAISKNSNANVPNWDEGFTFEMSPIEATSGHVRLEVWNKDYDGSDDFMGFVDIALANLRPSKRNVESSEGSEVTAAEDDAVKSKHGCSVIEIKEWLELKPRYSSQIVTGQISVELSLILTPDVQKRREKILSDQLRMSRKQASLKTVAVDNYQWQRMISTDSSGSPKHRNERYSARSPVPFSKQTHVKSKVERFVKWLSTELDAGRCPKVSAIEARLKEIKDHGHSKTAGHQSVRHLMTEAGMLDTNSQEWIKTYGFLQQHDDGVYEARNKKKLGDAAVSMATMDEILLDSSSSTAVSKTPEGADANLPKEYYIKDASNKVRGPIKLGDLRSLGSSSSDVMVRDGKDSSWRPIAVVLAEVVVQQRIEQVRKTLMSTTDPSCNLESWKFNILRLNPQSLMSLVTYDFSTLGVLVAFDVPLIRFVKFVRRVSELMLVNNLPYHNFYHACDVCHGVFTYLYLWGGTEYFTYLEIFALLVAAFCHDLRHPGKNNAFQVETGSDVAMRFNDLSVLENMHAALTYELLAEQNGHANIFISLEGDREQRRRARKVVCTTILATDMSTHFSLQKEFEAVLKHTETMAPTAAQHAAQNKAFILKSSLRMTLMKVMVHSADISNPTKSWPVAQEWSERVCEEFFAQGDEERRLGLPISANMDRKTTNKAKLSLGFIDFIVAPLFTNVVKLLPAGSEAVAFMASNRARNEKAYEQSLKKLKSDSDESKTQEMDSLERRKTMFNKFQRRVSIRHASQGALPIIKEEDEGSSRPPGIPAPADRAK